MRMLNTFFWKRIAENVKVDLKSLPVFRIIAACWILLFHFETFVWLGDLPDFLMKEPLVGLSNIFRAYPNKEIMYAIEMIRLVSVIFILLGVKARSSGVVFFVLTLYCKSMQYTLGSIEHDFLLYLLILVMSFSGWGTQLALIPDRVINRKWLNFSLSFLAICLCWGMFTAGIMKALIWVDFNVETSGFMRWLTEGVGMERNRFLTMHMLNADWRLLEVMDYLAVIFELTPLLALLFNRKVWLYWLLVAVTFHFVNILVLNINFRTHLLVYLVFIDWSGLFSYLQGLYKRHKTGIVLTSIVLFSLRFVELVLGRTDHNLVLIFFKDQYLGHLLFGLVLWVLVGYRLIIEIRREKLSLNKVKS
mgnify:CR=1 FL=1